MHQERVGVCTPSCEYFQAAVAPDGSCYNSLQFDEIVHTPMEDLMQYLNVGMPPGRDLP